MNYFLKLGFVLLLITVIASGILAFVDGFTNPIIKKNLEQAQVEARKEVLPNASIFLADSLNVECKETKRDPLKKEVSNSNNVFRYYVGKDADNKIVGYTFIAKKYGYSSEVKTMVGITSDLKINKIKIIFQSETPGLGANSVNPDFAPRFQNRKTSELVVDKDGGKIKSITGATITTRAVTNSIREGLVNLEKALSTKNGNEEDAS